jgi:hypothetical protein
MWIASPLQAVADVGEWTLAGLSVLVVCISYDRLNSK